MNDKAWYMSKGIWGGIIAIVAAIAGVAGYAVDAETQASLTEVAFAIAGSVGGLLAIIGRVKAEGKITK